MKKLKQHFRDWVYLFVTERLLEDIFFLTRLDLAIKENNKRIAEIKRDLEQRLRAEQVLRDTKKRQDSCSHLKGCSGVPSPAGRDYAIWDHTFPDGHRTVQCLICRKEWRGEQLYSEEVRIMLDNTTNARSASESVRDRKGPLEIPQQTAKAREDYAKLVAIDEENRTNPYWPWLSRNHIALKEKLLKKLNRKRKAN